MIKMEAYRICSRKAMLIALALGMLLLLFRYQMMSGNEGFSSGDGRYYLHGGAISRNQELAASYEGPMTMEKIRRIWEEYGAYDPNVVDADPIAGTITVGAKENFVQMVVQNRFCAADFSGDRTEYTLLSEEELRARGYLDEDLFFTYTGDFYWYWDSFLTAFIVICLVVIIGLAPLFAEDHALRVSDVVVTGQNGRQKCYRSRILAGMGFAGGVYLLLQGGQLLLWGMRYGWRALECSTIFTWVPSFYRKQPLWMTIVVMLACGLAAVLVLALITMAVSASCRQVFPAVLLSLLFFAGPFIVTEMFLEPLRLTFGVWLVRFLSYSTPFYYTSSFLESWTGQRVALSGVLAAYGLAALLEGGVKYCKRQK